MLHRWIRRACAAIVVTVFAACTTDLASNGVQEDELAVELEGLSQEANQRGDVDASSAYSAAAMAVRLGIRPTPIGVSVAGVTERYEAFVHVVSHARPNAASIRLRTLVAVHGVNRPEKILYVATMADSAELGHPTMTLDRRPDVRQLAWASWRDRVNGRIWVATSGTAGIVEESVGGECPKVSARADVQCTAGKFAVLLDGVFHGLIDNQRGQIDRARQLTIATRASGVNGAVLVF
jgi:hypothetical protein